jgi:hypothetical protein
MVWVNTWCSVGRIAGLIQLFGMSLMEAQQIRFQYSREFLNAGAHAKVDSERICLDTNYSTMNGWARRFRQHVRAVCSVFGGPALMVTVTGNDAQLDAESQAAIKGSGQARVWADGKALMCADLMSDILRIAQDSMWRTFCRALGLPMCTANCERVEAQLRGALHFHVLL